MEILDQNYLFARHKPGHDWNESLKIPDFTKIKIDLANPDKNQSFNWDKFSKPHWVRFDPNKKYLINYAVVGFSTKTIRNINSYKDYEVDGNIDFENLIDVEHKPIEINYSHCQLLCTNKFINSNSKKYIKRAIRMIMKHNSKVILKPNEESN